MQVNVTYAQLLNIKSKVPADTVALYTKRGVDKVGTVVLLSAFTSEMLFVFQNDADCPLIADFTSSFPGAVAVESAQP